MSLLIVSYSGANLPHSKFSSECQMPLKSMKVPRVQLKNYWKCDVKVAIVKWVNVEKKIE